MASVSICLWNIILHRMDTHCVVMRHATKQSCVFVKSTWLHHILGIPHDHIIWCTRWHKLHILAKVFSIYSSLKRAYLYFWIILEDINFLSQWWCMFCKVTVELIYMSMVSQVRNRQVIIMNVPFTHLFCQLRWPDLLSDTDLLVKLI